jgi:hypothetical protein
LTDEARVASSPKIAKEALEQIDVRTGSKSGDHARAKIQIEHGRLSEW